MNKITLSLCAIAGSLLLTGCNTNKPAVPQAAIKPKLTPAPEPAPKKEVKKPKGINGKWIPTSAAARAIYYNEFKNGKFVSRSPDGSKTIAAGSYSTLKSGSIQMNWYSEARKSNASAVCKKLSAAEMQCTSGGSIFNLRRA